MRKYRYISTCGIMTLALLCSGCSASETTSSEPHASGTAEVTSKVQSSEPERSSAESSSQDNPVSKATAEAFVPETSEFSDEVLGTLTMELPDMTGGYIADWIYGTWSVVSVNGQDFWDYADENGLDGEYQLIFDSTGCKRVSGARGVDHTYTYQITDDGAALYEEDMTEWCSLVYNPSKDTLTYSDGENYAEFKRGANPRNAVSENYEAGWIYGTWSVISVDGQEFWSWADENGVTGEYMLEFTSNGVKAISDFVTSESMKYKITDSGAVIYEDNNEVVLTYNNGNDTLTMIDDVSVFVLKRGTNPRSGAVAMDAELIYGVWRAVSMDGVEFGEWADENGVDGWYRLKFTESGCQALSGERKVNMVDYSMTEYGAVLDDGINSCVVVYDSLTDLISLNDGDIVMVMEREQD